MLCSIRIMSALLAACLATSAANASPPIAPWCDSSTVQIAPIGEGPLKLTNVRCFELPSNFAGYGMPFQPSPDSNYFFQFDLSTGLTLGGLEAGTPLQHFDADIALGNIEYFENPFQWFHDGRSVLGVTQDVMKPGGGWMLGPLRPFLASVDGKIRMLPSLVNEAGPLDELHWVGNRGLAIALFGAKGAYYRPEHIDPQPTIALVDALSGRVIQPVPLADLVPDASRTNINHVSSRVDERGRIEAVITLAPGRWIFWRQGSAPRQLPISVNPWSTRFTLSPDGRTVLTMRNLTASGSICEHNPNCPIPTPNTGPIAELYDLKSGKIIWAITGTAKDFSSYGPPVISPDGRYALITMPDRDQNSRNFSLPNTVALVAMATGKVLQRFPSSSPYISPIGFSNDSRDVWVSVGRRLTTYSIVE